MANTNQRASSPSSRGFFIGNRKTGKFKELHKIEEEVIGERGARFARIRFI
jgi:hypothetical protein